MDGFKEIAEIINGRASYNGILQTILTLNSTLELNVDSLKMNILINGPTQFDKSELKHTCYLISFHDDCKIANILQINVGELLRIIN